MTQLESKEWKNQIQSLISLVKDMGKNNLTMEVGMKENGVIVSMMEKENTDLQTDSYMKGNLKMVKQMVMEFIQGQMDLHTKEIGLMICNKVKDNSTLMKFWDIKDNIQKVKNTELDTIDGQMEMNTEVNGKMTK